MAVVECSTADSRKLRDAETPRRDLVTARIEIIWHCLHLQSMAGIFSISSDEWPYYSSTTDANLSIIFCCNSSY